MSTKIFQLFKIINPPYFPPLIKGEIGEFKFVLFYLQKKIYRKTYGSKK
jgi:hypothetical protein